MDSLDIKRKFLQASGYAAFTGALLFLGYVVATKPTQPSDYSREHENIRTNRVKGCIDIADQEAKKLGVNLEQVQINQDHEIVRNLNYCLNNS